ncbi:unnamed protein product, partial [Staurois parvus]
PNSAHQCCQPVPPNSARQCRLSVSYQCSLSVPISAASLAHISEGEKNHLFTKFYNKNYEKNFFFFFLIFSGFWFKKI